MEDSVNEKSYQGGKNADQEKYNQNRFHRGIFWFCRGNNTWEPPVFTIVKNGEYNKKEKKQGDKPEMIMTKLQLGCDESGME